jgi:hypothetical protein
VVRAAGDDVTGRKLRLGEGFMGCSAPERTADLERLGVSLAGHQREQLDRMAAAEATGGTIFFPDVSGYQNGLTIQPGTAALLAKATEGSTYTDPSYAGFRAQAARVGAVFGAYHFVWGGTASEAQHMHSGIGSTPTMLDVENTSVPLTLSQVLALVRAFRALGGVCHLAYIPKWYWQGTMGSPSLLPLAQLGVSVVSSYYTTYSDGGPGWAGYGGITPVQWQYTDALPYGGQPVDFNAFRGTAAAYRTLLTGSAPAPTPSTVPEDDDMITYVQEARVAGDRNGQAHGVYPPIWKAEAGFVDWMNAQDWSGSRSWAASQWHNAFAGGQLQVIDPGTLGAFGALRPGTAVPPAGGWSGKPLRGYTPPATATEAGPHVCDDQCVPDAPAAD